jgi:ABC-type dipeptide/oligopeptide/nickel transport system ATPase component
MSEGCIVEHAPFAALTGRPEHPLTRELLLASRALQGGAA